MGAVEMERTRVGLFLTTSSPRPLCTRREVPTVWVDPDSHRTSTGVGHVLAFLLVSRLLFPLPSSASCPTSVPWGRGGRTLSRLGFLPETITSLRHPRGPVTPERNISPRTGDPR